MRSLWLLVSMLPVTSCHSPDGGTGVPTVRIKAASDSPAPALRSGRGLLDWLEDCCWSWVYWASAPLCCWETLSPISPFILVTTAAAAPIIIAAPNQPEPAGINGWPLRSRSCCSTCWLAVHRGELPGYHDGASGRMEEPGRPSLLTGWASFPRGSCAVRLPAVWSTRGRCILPGVQDAARGDKVGSCHQLPGEKASLPVASLQLSSGCLTFG